MVITTRQVIIPLDVAITDAALAQSVKSELATANANAHGLLSELLAQGFRVIASSTTTNVNHHAIWFVLILYKEEV